MLPIGYIRFERHKEVKSKKRMKNRYTMQKATKHTAEEVHYIR